MLITPYHWQSELEKTTGRIAEVTIKDFISDQASTLLDLVVTAIAFVIAPTYRRA